MRDREFADSLLEEPGFELVVPVEGTMAEPLWYLDLDSGINECGAGQVCVEAGARIETASDERRNQQALSLVHSASFSQPARIRYSASSAVISTVRSGPMVSCRPEKVCTDPTSQGARRRTRKRSGFSGG